MMKRTKLGSDEEVNLTERKSSRLQTKSKRKLDVISEPPEEVIQVIKKTKLKKSTSKDEQKRQTTLFATLIKKETFANETSANEEEKNTNKKKGNKATEKKDVGGKNNKILSSKKEKSSSINIEKKGKTFSKKGINGKESISNIITKAKASKKHDKSDDDIFIDFELQTKLKVKEDAGNSSHKNDKDKLIVETIVNQVNEMKSVWTTQTPSIWNEDIFVYTNLPNHVQCLPIEGKNTLQEIPFKYNNLSLDTPVIKDFGSFIKISDKCNSSVISDVKLDSNFGKNIKNNNVLWTELYKPSKASEIIGSNLNIEFLASWLLEWKNKRTVYDNESSCSSYAWSEVDDEMIRCVLLTGSTGVGKTSLVYALAQEHKFKIFEVNASSMRGSKQIIGQLQEATQSHHVEGSASNALTRFLIKAEVIKDKTDVPNKKEITLAKAEKQKGQPRKNVIEEKPKGIMAYFNKCPSEVAIVSDVEKPKLNSIKNWLKVVDNKPERIEKLVVDKSEKVSQKMDKINKQCENTTENLEKTEIPGENQEGLKYSSSSIILFDDVDLVFNEDEGFWSSVNNFIKTTKKPVILTASRSLDYVMGCINSNFETINLDITLNQCAKFLRKITQDCKLSHGKEDLKMITRYCKKDIRKTLLQLQFWGDNESQSKNALNFNSPIIKYCLNKNLRKGMFDFLLNSDYQDSFQCLIQFESEGYFPLHANLDNWLPFPRNDLNEIPIKEKKIAVKKNEMDISWTSEDVIKTNDNELTKKPEKEPLVCALLEGLSSLFDDYSNLDQGFCTNKELYDNYKSYKSEQNNDLLMEIASWWEIAFCKKAKNNLTTMLENHRGDLKDSVYLIESEFCIEKFESLNQNISKAVDLISTTIIPVQHINSAFEKTEYISTLKVMNETENIRRKINSNRTRRFHHYFDANSLIVDENAMSYLSKLLK